MDGGAVGFWVVTALIILAFVFFHYRKKKRFRQLPPEEQAAHFARRDEELMAKAARQREMVVQRQLQQYEWQYGGTNPVLICPHCQQQGQVRTKAVTVKKGISGAKATGAVLTGGLSMLATGLSRKEGETQAHCDHCRSTWHF